MAYLIIKDGKIVNHVAWDGVTPWTPPEGHTLVNYDGHFDIGWEWDGNAAIAPPPVTSPPTPPSGGMTVT